MFVCAYVGLHVLFFNVILYYLSFIKIKFMFQNKDIYLWLLVIPVDDY